MDKIIVVYNSETEFCPIRHIVKYCDFTTKEDFWNWYYKDFTPLDDDRMKAFDTMGEALEFADKIR